MKKLLYIPVILLVLFLCFKYSEYSTCGRFRFAADVVYVKEEEGVFFYDSLKRKTRLVYKSPSSDESFVTEGLVLHNGNLIFASYSKSKGQTGSPKHDSIREYHVVNLEGGEALLYSLLEFAKGGDVITIKEDFKQKNMFSVFNSLPKEMYLLSKNGDNDSQLLCLEHQINGECVFVGPIERGVDGKVVYLWQFNEQSLRPVITFPQQRMALKDGGGGFVCAYLLTKDEAVFLEIPEQTIPVSMIGLSQFRESFLRKIDFFSGEVTTLTKFEGVPAYPKLSLDGKFIVFTLTKDSGGDVHEKNGEIWIREVKTGKQIKIGTGHSPLWVR